MSNGKKSTLAIFLFTTLGVFFYFAPKLLSINTNKDGGIEADFDVPNSSLLDINGKVFQLNSLKGKKTLLYFGYPNCPFVCPLAMKEMNKVIKVNKNMNYVFINIDKSSNSIKALPHFLKNYSEVIIGLNSGKDDTHFVATKFKNSFQGKFKKHLNLTYLLDESLKVVRVYNKLNADKFITFYLGK